jgi:hypothetical protein
VLVEAPVTEEAVTEAESQADEAETAGERGSGERTVQLIGGVCVGVLAHASWGRSWKVHGIKGPSG